MAKGARNLATGVDSPPMREEEQLRVAIETVRLRSLEETGRNVDLLEKADRWLRTVDAERSLARATAAARPDLEVVGETRLMAHLPGMPWTSSQTGMLVEGEARRQIWGRVERLAEALKEARTQNASSIQLMRSQELLSQLIARMPELPSDRCVLDPEGEGIRLLPMGKHRAILPTTGANYTYEPKAEHGDDVDDLPPREELGTTDVDDARPVCADFAEKRACKLGRRCPWRHVRPKKGDVIREAIVLEDA